MEKLTDRILSRAAEVSQRCKTASENVDTKLIEVDLLINSFERISTVQFVENVSKTPSFSLSTLPRRVVLTARLSFFPQTQTQPNRESRRTTVHPRPPGGDRRSQSGRCRLTVGSIRRACSRRSRRASKSLARASRRLRTRGKGSWARARESSCSPVSSGRRSTSRASIVVWRQCMAAAVECFNCSLNTI